MSTITPRSVLAGMQSSHRPSAPGSASASLPADSLKAVLRGLMGPAARRLDSAPFVHELDDAATTLAGAVRCDMHALAVQTHVAQAVLGVAGDVALDAVAVVRATRRLRRRS
jgi:hypothetical protein